MSIQDKLWRGPVLIYTFIFSWPESPSWAIQRLAQRSGVASQVNLYLPRRSIRITKLIQAASAFSISSPPSPPRLQGSRFHLLTLPVCQGCCQSGWWWQGAVPKCAGPDYKVEKRCHRQYRSQRNMEGNGPGNRQEHFYSKIRGSNQHTRGFGPCASVSSLPDWDDTSIIMQN